jgi:hypothetical protein
MKIEEAGSEYMPETLMVKAVKQTDDSTVCKGYFYEDGSPKLIDQNRGMVEINPYTICRNAGIKVDGAWLYEFDLVELESAWDGKELGFMEFDAWDSSWKIRRSLNYTSKVEIKKFSKINPIGNVILSKTDYQKMQDHSDMKEQNYKPETTTECRSTQHLNRKAKEFLPR